MDSRSKPTPTNFREAMAALFSPTGALLVGLFIVFFLLDEVLTDRIQAELMNPEGASNWIWVYGGLSFLAGLLGPIFTGFLAICAWRFPTQSLWQSLRLNFGYMVREEMRVMGQSLLWGLLLVIPGFIRFFQCSFVSYVVLLDPEYSKGQVDALQRSWHFVRKVWFRLLVLLAIFGAVIPIAMTMFDEWRSVLERPLTGLPLMLVELTVLLLFQWLILRAWDRAGGMHAGSHRGL